MNMDTIYSCHYKADVAQLKEIRVHEGNLMCNADMNFNLNFPETFFHSIEQHLLAGMEWWWNNFGKINTCISTFGYRGRSLILMESDLWLFKAQIILPTSA